MQYKNFLCYNADDKLLCGIWVECSFEDMDVVSKCYDLNFSEKFVKLYYDKYLWFCPSLLEDCSPMWDETKEGNNVKKF